MTSKNNQDPGWNDPPIFTYDKATAIQAAAADKKRTLLNKRVAFPISGDLGSNQNIQNKSAVESDLSRPPAMSQSLPPPPSSSSTPPPPIKKSEALVQPEVKFVPTATLEEVIRNLQIDSNCDEEIVKRIKIMEKMWTVGKLEENIQCRIFELSEALAKGDTETADYIQKGLMVDHVSQCSSWMSGIRHLINQKKNNTSKMKEP